MRGVREVVGELGGAVMIGRLIFGIAAMLVLAFFLGDRLRGNGPPPMGGAA